MTIDLERRLAEHNSPDNVNYTKQFQPWFIEAFVRCDSFATAERVELYFKNSSGVEKFTRFEEANPLHPNPKQGFFDTLQEGRAFGSGQRRFQVVKESGNSVFIMNS